MKALILVGGKGTRLKPYTTVVPKPLLPVGDKPILEIILSQLKSSGIEDITLAVGHMSQLFESFFQDGRRYGINISYSFEDKPLGTAGAIASVIDDLGEDFIVMNGDLLTTLDYRELINYHKANKASATIAISRREVQMDFGVIEVEKDGKLKSLVEKPNFFYNAGMGINVLNSNSVRSLLEKEIYLDMPDLMMKLRENGLPVFCYSQECFWLDMGRPEDYEKATEVYEERKDEF
jgi:NDP-sugar pyrophosphorylase family protein